MLDFVGNIEKREMFIVPIIKSAIKRVEVTKRQQQENRAPKSRLQNALKKYRALIAQNKLDEAEKLLPETVAIVDKSVKTGLIKKETANREKSRLALELQTAKNSK